MSVRALAGPLLALAFGSISAMAEPLTIRHLDFTDLTDWEVDDHAAALDAFTVTCGDLEDADWRALCRTARTVEDARGFFELFFKPVLIEDGDPALFTGYFEPELDGARAPDARFRFPLYRLPPDRGEGPWLTRRQIEEDAALADQALEIAWVDDPVELFFLQVQGSGRIRLPGGGVLRVGYGGNNGRPYSSVGAELVARGVYEQHQVSADVIGNWVRRNPEQGRELLWTNESFVFFRELPDLDAGLGPLGAMNRPVTPHRTIAVDPAIVPLGAPVWIEKEGPTPVHRLMVAQDTGSAIKGAQRADIFFGTGSSAGRQAGRIRHSGRMIVLLPIQRAYAILPERLE